MADDGRGGSPRRGRPRDPGADGAILTSTLTVLGERGVAGMSVDAVAERAGVAKTTIYRRYRDREELIRAALSYTRELPEPPEDLATRDALEMVLGQFRRGLEEALGIGVLGALLIETAAGSEFGRQWREQVIAPRRKILLRILARSVQRGELRASADVELAADMLIGSYLARYVAAGSVPPSWAADAVAAVSSVLEGPTGQRQSRPGAVRGRPKGRRVGERP